MGDRLPLPTLLSQVLVAFTIEFDNEFERQMPHRTTNHGSTPGALHAPWLVSLAMCENCMRFVGEQGVTVGALEELARTATNLNGMERWGYVVVGPNSHRRDRLIRPTAAGRKAQEIWRPLFGTIEERWNARFGKDQIGQLKESLLTVIRQFDIELPDTLPILGYGLFSRVPGHKRPARDGRKEDPGSRPPLSALLSRALLAFAIEFEDESDLSLAIGANVVRVVDLEGVRVRDLPRLSGVSKELIKTAVGWLEKRRYVVVEPATKVVRLTAKGREAQDAYSQRLGFIEDSWLGRFGEEAVGNLRKALECLIGNPANFSGIEPHPNGWRASVPRPERLPHYPMVSHRGGFPDGS